MRKYLILMCAVLVAGFSGKSTNQPAPRYEVSLLREAYIYAWPLVLMDATKRLATNVARKNEAFAPANRFISIHSPDKPGFSYAGIYQPDPDNYRNIAWLDLSDEPLILEVPEMKDHFYFLSVTDAWSQVISSVGTRNTGNQYAKYIITGPDWKHPIPPGMTELRSPTNTVWILGKFMVNEDDPEDRHEIQRLMNDFRLIPLTQYGSYLSPPRGDMCELGYVSPAEFVRSMSVEQYFNYFMQAWKSNPSPPDDQQLVSRMADFGIIPGGTFELEMFDKSIRDSIKVVPQYCIRMIDDADTKQKMLVNGWSFPEAEMAAERERAYLKRAALLRDGLFPIGAPDEDFLVAAKDLGQMELDGKNQYVLHFKPGETPAVEAFWSVMATDHSGIPAAGSGNRFSLSSRQQLQFNEDGSLDIYIQHEKPSDSKAANWLPAPEGAFKVAMHLYWPGENQPGAGWIPPGIRKVAEAEPHIRPR